MLGSAKNDLYHFLAENDLKHQTFGPLRCFCYILLFCCSTLLHHEWNQKSHKEEFAETTRSRFEQCVWKTEGFEKWKYIHGVLIDCASTFGPENKVMVESSRTTISNTVRETFIHLNLS